MFAMVARDLTQPSPLALEVLSARPYAYLDDAPLEERRTQAVMGRRWLAPESAADLGRLDPEAIARVRTEAWPDPVNAEELHDALLWLGCLNEEEVQAVPEWRGWLAALANENRVTRCPRRRRRCGSRPNGRSSSSRLSADSDALAEILRGRLEGLGPVTQAALAAPLGLEPDDIGAALAALEVEGFALRGRFTPGSNAEEWCDRRLLARIHHYTVRRLRAEIEPVAARDFLRFLFAWQRVTRRDAPGRAGLRFPPRSRLLEGFEAPAGAWETEILPARITGYEPTWLDDMCLAGRVAWARLTPGCKVSSPVRTTPITLLARRHAAFWTSLCRSDGRCRSRVAERRRCSTACARRARCSSRNWPRRAACCARRSRRRSANSSRWAW